MNPLSSKAPDEIVYLPEGEHTITPFVNGKAKEITVRVPAGEGESIAAALQESLEVRQRANVRPWLDFDHKAGVAAGLPKRFRYQAGQGIILEVDWTGEGRRAIEGRDFSYFSPAFEISADGKPARVASSGPVGALVNEPAFRELPRVAASHAGSDEPPSRIEAALAKAEAALAPHHGGNPPFGLVWDHARDLDPQAFDDPPQVKASEANVRDTTARVEAAQSKARQELGEDADFLTIWSRAAEIDPDAFN